jgi:ABC-type transport system involved in Fe-S cluster assembly fused permease/ATPase subunit
MRRASGSDMTMWAVGLVFTFIPTVVELVLVCGLLAQKVSGMVAAIVLVTFTAYVAWTVHITTQAAESRKQVPCSTAICVPTVSLSRVQFCWERKAVFSEA